MGRSLVFLFFLQLVGCTVYQSSGREAIEKGSIDVSTGFMFQKAIYYKCARSPELPPEALGAAEVIETPYEASGLTSLLLSHRTRALVLQISTREKPVHYCDFSSIREIRYKDLIELAEFTHQFASAN